MKFKDQIKHLSGECFKIEDQLPRFRFSNELTAKQEFRRELYRIRCQISMLERYAKLVDEEIAAEVKQSEDAE